MSILRNNVSVQTKTDWCERLYEAKAAGLILYGRALGLSHGEAEDVLQETFMALLRREEPPAQPEHYCVRSFRNQALNYRRTLWRRLMRELESRRWFERSADETPREREAMRCLAGLPAEQREVIVLKIWHQYTFDEIGDLLFAVVNLARKTGLDAEEILQRATNKFVARFDRVEDELHARGKKLGEANLESAFRFEFA